ncbi:MAG: hypothetical protein ACSHYF_13870 [Verrucomicrobiaceae bacterium]
MKSICMALCTLGAVSLSSAQTLIFSDSMDAPFYDSFSFNGSDSGSNPDDLSSESQLALGTGGNPGGLLRVTHSHEVASGPGVSGSTFVQSFFVDQTFTYTPSVDGAIDKISFSIDLKSSDPFSSVFFNVEDATTGGGSSSGFTSFTTDGDWHTVSVVDLDASNFSGRDFSGSTPLAFGFGFYSSAELVADTPTSHVSEQRVVLADNFKVTVTQVVPEPSVVLLGSLALLGGCLVRRR